MKITNINNYMAYKNTQPKAKKTEAKASMHFDVIEINSRAKVAEENVNAANSKTIDIEELKKRIVSEVNTETAKNKLEKIKSQINEDLYTIDEDEIAGLLLD